MALEQIKMTVRTASGSLIRVPATLDYRDGRIFFLKSPFALKNEIKAMRGSKWHGYDEENPRKIWSVEDCPRNRFQLGFLCGEDVYAWFDREIVRHEYRPLTMNGKPAALGSHQKDMADAGLTYHYQIFGAEMGCVDGEAVVHVHRASKGFQTTLANLHRKFHGGKDRGRVWDLSIPTYIRSLCGRELRLNKIVDVLYKGTKAVVKLTLKSGKNLKVTPDHEICVGYDQFKPADQLKAGDIVFSNGKWVDKDGYVRVGGLKNKHPRHTTGGVYEHILVAEKMLGRPLKRNERVHHKNRIKHDNRPENLAIHDSDSGHAALHGKEGGYLHLHGGISDKGSLIQFVPDIDSVVSVEPAGQTDVYDVVCANPHRNFVANGVVVHNCGKTLAAQMVIENSGLKLWYWVGPKTSLPNMKREFKKWHFPFGEIEVVFMTYEGLVRLMDEWDGTQPLPQGVVADESSRCKNHSSQRSQGLQKLADMIREKYGFDGYVIEMSGTPSPKTPVDWWSQMEIAWPGFLKEGGPKQMEERLAFMSTQSFDSGSFKKRDGWKDDERKCSQCGLPREEGPHEMDGVTEPDDYHPFEASKNEVAYLYERLRGLVIIKHKKDCLDLPDKRYRRILCKPSPSVLRVAEALAQAAPNAITGMTWLRELSDGFQYRDVQDGMTACTHCPDGTVEEWYDPVNPGQAYSNIDMLQPEKVARLQKHAVPCPLCKGTKEVPKMIRVAREVPCPKDAALKMLLEENEEQGRLVAFAGFTGSVDRMVRLALEERWDVVRCDQGSFQIITNDGLKTDEEPLDYWADLSHPRVLFASNPESGGMSLTLTESRMIVYWSNSWKPEYRMQSEDRCHRIGMDVNKGCTIVDLVHLPSDARVLDVLRANRKLELMTMGEVLDDLDWKESGQEGAMLIEESH